MLKTSYNDRMKTPIFDFGDIKKRKDIIEETWQKFRSALANREFKYNEVDRALTTTFLKVFDDLFTNCNVQLEYSLRNLDIKGYLVRGTKLKPAEIVSYDRFLPKAEFINEDNRFSPVGVEWLYLAWARNKDLADSCAIKECRATVGNRFGICSFNVTSAYKDRKIIDLTLADEMTLESINAQLEKIGNFYRSRCYKRSIKAGRMIPFSKNEKEEMKKAISSWVLYTYLKLLSEQIFIPLSDTDDKCLMYAPFQCIAQYFLNKGYAGIKYKSTVCAGAKDVVLFDKTWAAPIGTIQDFTI